MKKLRYLILGLLALAGVCRAQDIILTNAGWFPIGSYDTTNNPPDDGGGAIQIQANIVPMASPTPPIIAEVITPRIQALADGLQDDPVKIFNYVHDHIRYVLYFGSKKGAELTLLEKSGNDFDQCALLVALLRAAGYSNAGYQFGWMAMPFDNPDGSHRDIQHWLGLTFTNSNWSATSAYLNNLLVFWRSYPNITGSYSSNFGNNIYAFQRVWVTVTIGGTGYLLDPAFKVSEPITGISLPSAMGSSVSGISNALMTAAGGVDFGTYTNNFYATNLNETALNNALAGYTTSFLAYIQSNYPNASVEQILSGRYIVPSTNTALSQCFLFQPTNMGAMSVITWVNEPTNLMSTLKINFAGKSYQWFMPQLQGQRLSLVYGSSTAALWQDDTNLASGTFTSADNVTLTVNHPRGNWDVTNNLYIQGSYVAGHTATYFANSSYAILYAFEPDWGWLQERQKQLESYRQQGYSSTSRQVVTETLNVMGLNWQVQVEYLGRTLAAQIGVLPMTYQRIGRMGQESGHGYYVDVYLNTDGSASSSGQSCDFTCDKNHGLWFDQMCYFSSAMEHGMIEQLQSSNLIAASSIKMLQYANANHQAIYLANSSNWSVVQTKLSNYTISDLTTLINAGYLLLLPKNGSNVIAGSGSWGGFGFLAKLANGGGTQMLIGPGIFGGYAGNLGATVDPYFVGVSSYSQPFYFSSSPVSVPNITGADPVNMADGTFQVQATDLTLGQTEPRGLSFSRYYNSSRRNSNLAGIAHGWIHNYYLNATTVSAPQAGLGGTTPAQMAAMLVATASAMSVYNGAQPDPKNWMVTALIAKWGIDQLTAKAVSVILGNDTVQFIKQPDGSFTPPANCTFTLTQATNSAYSLRERHGRTFQFNKSGWGTNIVDQYGQSLSLAYNSSNWVSTVTDWKGRTLTLAYSGTSPKRLASVTDSAGRAISLGYSSGDDLISVVDPESKTNKFLYDTNHQITATFNAAGQLVASNIFNGFGRVTNQLTQGNSAKTWKIYWSGWQTVSQDPAGGQQSYFYDDKTRVIAEQDALGNINRKIYDGQDHVVTTISPLGETNQFIFDSNNNMTQTVDPLNFTNQFFYDGQNNLISAVDANGNPTTFGYNPQFSLTGQTNGAGDWVNYIFTTSGTLAGTLASRTDAGGTTSYDYDSTYGQLNSVTYPNSLGSENFVNNPLGDPTSHTDARGFTTTFQYNARRELTNTVAPTNLTVKVSFDAVGNVASLTDARGFTSSNTWSATRHLFKTTLPATPQGVPAVTNTYDNRDWLIRTVDSQLCTLSYSNDAAGRMISMTDPVQRRITFGYDANGQTTSITNAAQTVTRQAWDARGKPFRQTDGAQHTSVSAYDPAGNLVALTNRNGKKWQFKFDGANRLSTTITPLNRQTVLTFNHQGSLATVTDPANQKNSLYYDAKGRLTNRTDNVATTLYSFDANDNPTNISEAINSQPSTINYSYDAYNRMSSFADVYGNLIQYRYDANGNVTNLVYPGGKNVYYAFDSLNRMTNVTDWSGRKTSITYDLASRVTGITRPNGSYRTIGYDAAGQATNIMEQMSNSLPIAIFKLNWTNSGSMAWEFAAPLPHTSTAPLRQMQYDDDNRLSQFRGPTMGGYQSVGTDADGNITSAPLTNDTFVSYAYDARNRLLNAGGVTNAYDPVGNRIGQTRGTNTTVFVVNPNAALPQVLMRIKNGSTNYYIYGAGLLYQITETATATNTLTYHNDYRGSTVAISSDSDAVTDRIEYSAYGLTTYRTGVSDTPFLFNGKYGVQTDASGLLYMQARYYNPYLCRFVSADPAGFGGGLNHYAYANGNPVSLIDPFGLGAMGEMSGASWLDSMKQQAIYDQLAGPKVTFDGIVNGLLGLAEGVASTPWNMAYGMGGDINTAISGQDNAGNQVSGLRQTWAAASVLLTVVPIGDVAQSLRAAAPSAYSVAFETQLAPAAFAFSSRRQMQIANNALEAEQSINPQLANFIPAPMGWGEAPEGWIWHHATFEQANSRFGVLQLVPEAQHTSGSSFWPLLHPGNFGGYWQWAVPAGAPPR